MCSQYRGKIDPSISSPSLQILPCSNARNRTLRHPPQTVPFCQCVTGQVDGKRPTHGLGGPGHKDGTPTTRQIERTFRKQNLAANDRRRLATGLSVAFLFALQKRFNSSCLHAAARQLVTHLVRSLAALVQRQEPPGIPSLPAPDVPAPTTTRPTVREQG